MDTQRSPEMAKRWSDRRRVTERLVLLCAFMVVPLITTAAPFSFHDVVSRAKHLAKRPYKKPSTIPKFLRKLNYGVYSHIKLRPKGWLWSGNHSRFHIGPLSAGYLFDHPVKLHVVDQSGVHTLPYAKENFRYPTKKLYDRIPANLGYAGFQIGYAFGSQHTHRRSFLVFLGASYFRGIGYGQVYGSSARGIAVNTGLESGEQFPRFTQYWLVHPSPNATAIKFYALLNGESLTGAYRFVVYPGRLTYVKVKAVLFTRNAIKRLGVAPLTSMFLFGANTRAPSNNWRPQVHDADGLLIHNGTGEWLWRPLINPLRLQTNLFASQAPKGFGLFQRGTSFSLYQSLSARYEERPSIWVKPRKSWGKGDVVLIEIPSASNNNDNIDAFWTPSQEPTAGERLTFRYTLRFGGPEAAAEPVGHVVWTRVGVSGHQKKSSNAQRSYHFVVEFTGGRLATLPPYAHVVGNVTPENGTTVREEYVQYVPPLHQWRLNIMATPGSASHGLRLRAFLEDGKHALTETWTYQLPINNDLVRAAGSL